MRLSRYSLAQEIMMGGDSGKGGNEEIRPFEHLIIRTRKYRYYPVEFITT
jgi:hypothetical protein